MSGQVSRLPGLEPDSEMGVVGYALAAGVALILLPVLPFLAVIWLLRRVVGSGHDRQRSAG